MTKTIARTATVAAPKAFAFKGKGSAARNNALIETSVLAYLEGKSRDEIVANVRLTLGASPSAEEVTQVRLRYVIGRTASRLRDDPKVKGKPVTEVLDYADQLVTRYQAPLKDGVKSTLRKGMLGFRTVAQHKAIRAAEEAWSQVKAEALPSQSNAKTQDQRNAGKAAKRGTNATPARGADKAKAGTGITHTELVKADGPVTRADACEYLAGMAATMLAFCNKHAAVLPTDHGTAVNAFKRAIDKAEGLRKSVAE